MRVARAQARQDIFAVQKEAHSIPAGSIAAPLAAAPALCTLGARDLTERFARHELSPIEATKAALARAHAINPELNAFSLIDDERALADAAASEGRWLTGNSLGLLDGVPATIKDLVWVQGWPIRAGSRTTTNIPAECDAPSVAALRDAGAILIGLTTTPEFGWKAVTDSPLSGITRNAWNPALTAGGSSGGAAVAAATGAGVLHLGTDGGGSIRIPAAFNGVVGHKPSFGRVPAYPSSAFGTVAHIGPIARRVEDAMAMLDVMSRRDLRDWRQSHAAFRPTLGEAAKLADIRLGIWDEPAGGHVDGEIAQSFEAALALLSFSGSWLSPVSLPLDRARAAFDILWRSGAANRLQAIDPAQRRKIDPGFRALAEAGARYSSVDFLGAESDRATLGSAFDQLLTQVDLIVSPAVAILPFEAGRETPSAAWPDWPSWAGFSYPVNLAQLPACTVPFGVSRSGLPLAIQFIGRRGDDDKVLQVARAFEAVVIESEAA